MRLSLAHTFPSCGRFLLDPSEGEAQGGSLPADATPESPPPVQEEAVFNPADEPADSGVADLSAAPPSDASSQATQWQSIRDAAKAYGYDLSQYGDDRAALSHLIQAAQQARQANVYAQLGQQLAPHAQDIQSYLASRQAPQKTEPDPWTPPEFDDRWLSLVERDPATGLFYGKQGVPAEIVNKVNSYAQWQQKWSTQGPQMVEQIVERRVSDAVEKAVQARLADYQRAQAVDQIVAANASWIYQRDDAGNFVRDHQGQPVPSQQGVRYAQHIRTLQQSGVTDPRIQDNLARQLLAGELAYAAQQRTSAPPQQQQQNALVSGNRQVNPLQTRPIGERQATPGATNQTSEGKSLADMLRDELDKAGVTDFDFNDQ